VIHAREITYTDTEVAPGNSYAYSVTPYNFKGREGAPSPDVIAALDDFPPPPDGLKAVAVGKDVALEWGPPPRPAGIRGYRVYRAESDRREDMQPIGGTRWAETEFHDKNVETAKRYFYTVRSLKMNRGIPYESQPSETVTVGVPLPHTQPPENVRTRASRAGIRVWWDPVKLAGGSPRYNVYRSESAKMFVRANAEPLETLSFLDKDVTVGKVYRYSITSFPQGKPAQESSRTASEAVQFRP